jgi:hypothetical protein
LSEIVASDDPPRSVESSAETTILAPSTRPVPKMALVGVMPWKRASAS